MKTRAALSIACIAITAVLTLNTTIWVKGGGWYEYALQLVAAGAAGTIAAIAFAYVGARSLRSEGK